MMAHAFDLGRFPEKLRALVERAFEDVEACADAIEALESHVRGESAENREPLPDILVALAVLTFEEAAQLVLSRIADAAEYALALSERAIEAGAGSHALEPLRAKWTAALERERSREANLLRRLARGKAHPRDVVELAHRLFMRGDDDELASELLRRASAVRSEPPPSEPPPPPLAHA
jgi:hypothetical protein